MKTLIRLGDILWWTTFSCVATDPLRLQTVNTENNIYTDFGKRELAAWCRSICMSTLCDLFVLPLGAGAGMCSLIVALPGESFISFLGASVQKINSNIIRDNASDSCSYQISENKMSRNMTKPTTWHVRAAKTQISLGIRQSSLSAWKILDSLGTNCPHSEGIDQTRRMSRLIGIFAGRKGHCIGFVMRRLKCCPR